VLEFAGSPKSGKSTAIEIVSHFFRRMQFAVYAPSEGASKRTPYHLRRNLVAFNAWTLNYAISELLVTYYAVDRPHVIFLDRGAFDSTAWMRVLAKRGQLSDEELSIITNFALHPEWVRLVSRLYLFTCDPATSLERENEAKLIVRSGTAMNQGMLEELLSQYAQMRDELGDYPLRSIETSAKTTPKGTAYEIANDVIDLVEKRLS